jgi:hypothetical protein
MSTSLAMVWGVIRDRSGWRRCRVVAGECDQEQRVTCVDADPRAAAPRAGMFDEIAMFMDCCRQPVPLI